MTNSSQSFFGTLSVLGCSLSFGKPIPPITKVDGNGSDVVVTVEDPDHIWVSSGTSNSLDVYFESLNEGKIQNFEVGGHYKIWVRAGVHCGKCFVLRPDGRVALRLPWDFEGKDKFSVNNCGPFSARDARYGLVPYDDTIEEITLLKYPGYLARHAVEFDPMFDSARDQEENDFRYVITVTEINPKVTFPTVYSA